VYGWRARIGHVAPSRGDILVHEFYQVAPDGVMLLNTTGSVRNLDRSNLERQIGRLEDETAELVANLADVVILGGSPLFTQMGHGSDQQIREQLSAKFGIPVVPGITCEEEALRHFGIERVAVITPYPGELDENLATFLRASQFDVVNMRGMGVSRNAEIGAMTSQTVYRLGREMLAQSPTAEGLLIACPRWPTLDAVPLLEQDFGVPVIASCQANIWYAFNVLSLRAPLRASSRLLRSVAPD